MTLGEVAINRPKKRHVGTNQLKRSLNIFPQILVSFKIKNLATDICVKDCDKVAPGKDGVLKFPTELG